MFIVTILYNVTLLNKIVLCGCSWDLVVRFCNILNKIHPLRKVLGHALQVGFPITFLYAQAIGK